MKVWKARLVESGPEVTLIRVPISSTTEDRDGDEFSLAGLESMLAGLKSGKIPLYLDHGFRESGARLYGALDMLGAWIDGEIEGSTLYGTAFLEPDNWPAMELARKIEAGLPMGFSVGFGITKSRSKDNGGLIFDEVSLWEVSAVGIPSNPDAVNSAAVQAVVKSLRIKAGLETDEMKRKTKETEEEPKEEEQEEEKQPESCEEEEKAQEEEPTEEDEEEEKSYEVLDEAQIRQIVADEMQKQLAPIAEALKSLNEIKTLVTKAVATRSKGPRGIVVAREVKESQTNAESTARADFIIP
ncbi:MAG TPA: HK97 family phage prohead protease [Corynebacterium sp.]|nr:HK97 family phage prohead protease [Corynebacterium sp.]